MSRDKNKAEVLKYVFASVITGSFAVSPSKIDGPLDVDVQGQVPPTVKG